MNLLFRVLFAHGCRSTHHKLALDALCHLRCDGKQRWQQLFLKHHKAFLQGAKAPDKEFKDFRNHVLHVRDNYWGGAAKSARKWYTNTVQALQQQEWETAAYNAGVLSHYYTDPIQPFHTGQTAAENNIHRAAEWSITKSYDAIRRIIFDGDGYPRVETSRDSAWLEELVISGAELSNQFYEELIDRYDMVRGVKNPPAGLDQESREFLARLVGHATVGFARVMDRAFEEAHVTPPNVNLSIQGFLATLTIPIRWITKKMHDGAERKLVEAMYAELQATGKVEQTLPEDDREVRQMHKKEVIEGQRSADSDYVPKKHVKLASATRKPRETESPPTPTVHPAPITSRENQLRFHLNVTDEVVDAASIGPKTAARLNRIGVATVSDLLELSAETAAAQIRTRHITPDRIRTWQAQARLACQVPEIRGHDAQILVACGWTDPSQIASADPNQMLSIVDLFIDTSEGRRILRSGRRPDKVEITNWIDWSAEARQLRAA